MTYRVQPNHIFGPAIIGPNGWLVDNGPLESMERIAAALNAAEDRSVLLNFAVPEWLELSELERDRVMRALSKRVRQLLN